MQIPFGNFLGMKNDTLKSMSICLYLDSHHINLPRLKELLELPKTHWSHNSEKEMEYQTQVSVITIPIW